MRSKILFHISFIFCLSFSTIWAQYYDPEKAKQTAEKQEQSPPKAPMPENNPWEKVYFGGNIGLQFGRVTAIQLTPLVGYRFTDRLSAGGIFTYIYAKQIGFNGYSVYGLAPFARFMITEEIFLTGEINFLNTPDFTSRIADTRAWTTLPMLGGGYLVKFGQRGGMIISILYNFNYKNVNSIYGPLVIRTGFFF